MYATVPRGNHRKAFRALGSLLHSLQTPGLQVQWLSLAVPFNLLSPGGPRLSLATTAQQEKILHFQVKRELENRELAQYLITFAALPEVLNPVPSVHVR